MSWLVLIQGVVTAVVLLVFVVEVVYLLVLLRTLARWLASPALARWWRTPPGPWRKDARQIMRLLESCWRDTKRILRFPSNP